MQREYEGWLGLPSLSGRHLAGLNDTMFGVAMTLEATTLVPRVDELRGTASEILGNMAPSLTAVGLSFGISAIYWLSQQRRLLLSKRLTRIEILLHLFFLLLIVLLPLSTELIGRLGNTQGATLIYGSHLMLIAIVNLGLWCGVHARVPIWPVIVPAALAPTLLAVAVGTATARPDLAEYFWFATLALAPVTALSDRLRRRSPAAVRR